MEIRELRRLLAALVAAGVNDFTLETGEYKLNVKRGHFSAAVNAGQGAGHDHGQQAAPLVSLGAAQTATSGGAPGALALGTEAGWAGGNLVEVHAPIVGTFYSAPSPDAPAYVNVGDRVKPGAVLCIIEAMKLMNEIEAETAGIVREILVSNDAPVEYGQVLFRIEPD